MAFNREGLSDGLPPRRASDVPRPGRDLAPLKPAPRSDARVAAIRADETVGADSCSFIDETFTDAELAAELNNDGILTPGAAVEWAREYDAMMQDCD